MEYRRHRSSRRLGFGGRLTLLFSVRVARNGAARWSARLVPHPVAPETTPSSASAAPPAIDIRAVPQADPSYGCVDWYQYAAAAAMQP